MPGKELTIENGEVRDAEGDDPRKFYQCEYCDAVRGTPEGIETHVELKHSEAES